MNDDFPNVADTMAATDRGPLKFPQMNDDLTIICSHCGGLLSIEGFDLRGVLLCALCRSAFVTRVPVRRQETSRKATDSMLLGFLTVPFCVLAGIPAIVMGALALREIDRSEGRLKGQLRAVVGIALGILGNVCTPIFWAFFLATMQVFRHLAGR